MLLIREPTLNKGNVLSKTDELTEKVIVLKVFVFIFSVTLVIISQLSSEPRVKRLNSGAENCMTKQIFHITCSYALTFFQGKTGTGNNILLIEIIKNNNEYQKM